MAIYGYHRTSTAEQHLDRGVRAINDFNGVIFAQEWANLTNGSVMAAVPGFGIPGDGRTLYHNIYPDDRNFTTKVLNKLGIVPAAARREVARAIYGFSKTGSLNYPTVTLGSSWKIFTPN